MIGQPDIPLIDLKAHPDSQSLSRALHQAATSLGFMYLVNTDIAAAPMFALAKDFFLNEAQEEKERCGISTKNLGYAKPQQESLDPSKPGDRKEVINIGICKQDGHIEQELPSRLAAQAETIAAFQRACHGLVLKLMEALAIALELPQDTLKNQNQHHDQNTSILRLLRYPATSGSPNTQARAGAHSDYGNITLLFQEYQPAGSGLQVLPPTADPNDEAAWQDVPVVPNTNAVLINIGDALELQTGALYRSTVHRVVEVPSSNRGDRYSIAFFNQPNSDVLLESLVASNEVTANDIARMERKGVKLGEKVTADEHLQRRLQATYSGRKER